MSKLASSVLEVRPGHSRVPVVWLAPARVREHDQINLTQHEERKIDQLHQQQQNDEYVRSRRPAGPLGVLASAGRWVEREPNVFARQRVAIPVTVGSHLR
jgi:hypothetical protein